MNVLSNPTAHLLWALLAVNIIKGLAVFLAAYLITRLGKRISPDHKHLIWFSVIISFIVLPVLWFFLPDLNTTVRLATGVSQAWRLTAAPFLSRDLYLDHVLKAYQFFVFPRETRTAFIASALLILGGVWLAGMLFYTSRFLVARVSLNRLHAEARSMTSCKHLLEKLTLKLRVKRSVTLLSSNQCGIPFTYGFREPTIILPEEARKWSRNRLRSVLIHELAHIKRGDFLFKSITSIICSLFWFLPIVWLAHSLMLREEEKSCDRKVLGEGIPETHYAADIVEVVHSSKGQVLLPSAYCAIGKKGRLKDRIKTILSGGGREIPRGFLLVGKILLIAICVLIPLLSMTYSTKPYIPGDDEVLYGAWAPELSDWETIWEFSIRSGGEFLTYIRNKSDPMFESRFKIEDKWIDMDGNTCYKIKAKEAYYPYDHHRNYIRDVYLIIRINPAGNTFEGVYTGSDYAQEFSTVGGGAYGVFVRQ